MIKPTIDDTVVETIRQQMERHDRYDPHGFLLGYLTGNAVGVVRGVYIPKAEEPDKAALEAFEVVNHRGAHVLGVVAHIGDMLMLHDGDIAESQVRSARSMLPFYPSNGTFKGTQKEVPHFSVVINAQGSYQTTHLINRDR